IMSSAPFDNSTVTGIFLQDNTTPSGVNRNSNSIIANNIVYGFNSDPVVWSLGTSLAGITVRNNAYFSVSSSRPLWVGGSAQALNLTDWQSQLATDNNSMLRDPLLTDPTAYHSTDFLYYSPNGANPTSTSPVWKAGVGLSGTFADNFASTPRADWSIGA